MTTADKIIKWTFWGLWIAIVAVCSYFIMANAAWVDYDDSQVIMYTGWDKPIFGFFVDPAYGRFFPLDYTVYDILPIFYDGQIPPSAHYAIHVFWFIIYMAFFAAIGLHILKEEKTIWKYTITFLLLLTVLGRTYGLLCNYGRVFGQFSPSFLSFCTVISALRKPRNGAMEF